MSSPNRKPGSSEQIVMGFPLAEAAGRTIPFDGKCVGCGEPMEPVSARQWFCPSCVHWAVLVS